MSSKGSAKKANSSRPTSASSSVSTSSSVTPNTKQTKSAVSNKKSVAPVTAAAPVAATKKSAVTKPTETAVIAKQVENKVHDISTSVASRVNPNQLKRAIHALYAYLVKQSEENSKNSLFDDDQYIYLMVTLTRIPDKGKNMPIRIPISHPFYGQTGDICLLTKDPVDLYRDTLETNPVEGITKVLSISKLRSNYRQFKDRRDLEKTYELFMADERIIPLLPPLLGKIFFDKKKQPIAVRLNKKNIQKELQAARDSTYMFISTGASIMIKVGRSSQSIAQIQENIETALPHIMNHLPKKWKGIQSLFIKTHDSVALPIYQQMPDAPDYQKQLKTIEKEEVRRAQLIQQREEAAAKKKAEKLAKKAEKAAKAPKRKAEESEKQAESTPATETAKPAAKKAKQEKKEPVVKTEPVEEEAAPAKGKATVASAKKGKAAAPTPTPAKTPVAAATPSKPSTPATQSTTPAKANSKAAATPATPAPAAAAPATPAPAKSSKKGAAKEKEAVVPASNTKAVAPATPATSKKGKGKAAPAPAAEPMDTEEAEEAEAAPQTPAPKQDKKSKTAKTTVKKEAPTDKSPRQTRSKTPKAK